MTKSKMTTKAIMSTAVLALVISIMPTGNAFSQTNFGVIQAEAATATYTAKSNVNLRTGGSLKHKIVTQIKKGQTVKVVSYGSSWSKVIYGSTPGYVSTSYLKKGGTPTQVSAPSSSATNYTAKSNVNLRTGGSLKHKIITQIKKGQTVKMVSYNSKWSKVLYGSKTGYVSTSYLTKTAEKKPVTASATKYVTTDRLNMRTGASTKYKIITTIPKGKTVTYVSKSGSWYKVKYGSKTGWVSSAYLKKPGTAAEKYPAPSTNTPGKYVDGVLIVNKKYSLPSTYNPGINSTAQKALNAMVADAKKQKVYLSTVSSYRSYWYQNTLYNNYVKKHGKAKADRFSARPGYSEHQTGLAFDFGGTNQKHWFEESFASTKEGKWLASNAHKYGFHLRYQKGKESVTGYMYEPWHFRYLGQDMATKVKTSGKTLEEYFNVSGK